MTKDDFVKQQYLSLREEIQTAKARAFWILVVGVVLVVSAGFLAAALPATFANAAIPLVLLVLILAFAVEQNGIIRAGRYIKEQIEPQVEDLVGWEAWLESNHAFRDVDRYFFGCFVISFFGFFAVSCYLSLNQLNNQPSELLVLSAASLYALGGISVVYVLIRHWHSCTSTSDGTE